VFSTYLYTGTGAAQTITNGIDLDGEGGLVWIKSRSAATSNFLFDTNRGVTDEINSDSTGAEASLANSLTAFNSDGFSISSATGIGVNAATYASWTFRKAEKFFDVVTWTGSNDVNTDTGKGIIPHNLGSAPGCVIIKNTSDGTANWIVYHRSLSGGYRLLLNTTGAQTDSGSVSYFSKYDNTLGWVQTNPDANNIYVGYNYQTNGNGNSLVAYLFAHDAGGFGDDGLQNVVTCGSFTSDASGGFSVNLGWEPQWIMHKVSTGAANQDWKITDVLRGMTASASGTEILRANTSGAASTGQSIPQITATGFFNTTGGTTNSAEHIYIAIRRGPMKTPTAGTEVYNAVAATGSGVIVTGFVTDAGFIRVRTSVGGPLWGARLTGTNTLNSTSTAAQSSFGNLKWDRMDGFWDLVSSYFGWGFKRAPGFFDVVCYTGTGSATTFNHNLGVVPELIIVKKRSATDDWAVYASDNTDFLLLNTTAATADDNTYWNDTSPTSTVFSVGTNADVNTSAATYVAYLFASLAGVSKIGTYTGNGSSVTVTTGFQPRFILVKRTDSTGNWIYGDSTRGLVAGDDPFSALNTTDAETTNQDWVDITSTSFTVNETAANANVNAATYIYLCIS
jgi:hypothetical protein